MSVLLPLMCDHVDCDANLGKSQSNQYLSVPNQAMLWRVKTLAASKQFWGIVCELCKYPTQQIDC